MRDGTGSGTRPHIHDAPPSPIPAPVEEVLQLFSSELSGVRFPHLDCEVLGALADEVRHAAAALEDARRQVESARARLEERREALVARAEQGVAYARVFAHGEPELAARIDGIGLGKPRPEPKKTPRKRRRKAAADDRPAAAVTELPLTSPQRATLEAVPPLAASGA